MMKEWAEWTENKTTWVDPYGKEHENHRVIRRNGVMYFDLGNGQMIHSNTGEQFPLDHGL
ncbi:predicted protein [Cyanophage PSS2]|uniref:hypothetical protein n=1 Tax=Cyanophage PSS2 TaxID=658401 RepID=UPI0001B0400F|nr:hypothetical protein PSS2_gp057 [Cyanophage PSS2]ACT65619.1 hypothetical protein [Cyanophage PSS2]ACY75761.1 predicted protein [Cyanophage PSS2]